MAIELVTPTTVTPFTLEEVKDHLRVVGTDDDSYIQELILVMVDVAQAITRRAIYTSTWKLYLDRFPCASEDFELPRPKLQSITSITYKDGSGNLQTVPSSDYQYDAISEPARLRPAPGKTWPVTEAGRMNAVTIEFVAGWVKRWDAPSGLRQAMLYHVAHLFECREPAVVGTIVAKIPNSIEAMYATHRVLRFY